MKHIFILSAFAAMVAIVSCGKGNANSAAPDTPDTSSVSEQAEDLMPKSNYDYTINGINEDDGISEEAVISLVKAWDQCHRLRSTHGMDTIYSTVCLYYGTDQPKAYIIQTKQTLFEKYPEFQQYIDDINISVTNSATIDVTFNKHVCKTPGDKWETYKSYLHLIGSNDDWYASWESDETTDANLERRNQKNPRPSIEVDNTTPLAAIFNDKNVGKDICTDYWSLVGFEDDAVEGPLAAAMMGAEVIGARNAICGTLRKGYLGDNNTYYCGGTCSGGEFTHRVLWIYSKLSGKLSVYPSFDAD